MATGIKNVTFIRNLERAVVLFTLGLSSLENHIMLHNRNTILKK